MAMDLRMQTFITLCHLATGILTFNHTTSKEQCKGHGGLASSRHFIYNKGRDIDVSPTLNEGESAWITGNVIFSKFVSWYGCFDIKDTPEISKYSLTENNIYNCLALCSSKPDIYFIGLQKKVCYCMELNDYHHLVGKPQTECEMQLIEPYVANNNNDLSSREIKANVYIIINDNTLVLEPDLPVARSQCVYIKFTGSRTVYVTESCFTLAKGFICENSASTFLNKTCHSFYPALTVQYPAFCMVTNPSSWLTSFHECVNYSGRLTYTVYPRVTTYIKPDAPYWTGIFRSFNIESEEFTRENSVCLSIKKLDSKLVFDPADCSASKRYICEDGVSENTHSTSDSPKESESEQKRSSLTTTVSKTNAVSSVSYLTTPTRPTTMLSKGNETEGEITPSIYIAISVVLTLLFALVLTCLILRKRRKGRKSGHRSKDDLKTTATDTGINARSTAVYHSVPQSHVLIHQHTETAEEFDYATPNKVPIKHNVPECDNATPNKAPIKHNVPECDYATPNKAPIQHNIPECDYATPNKAPIQHNVPESEYDSSEFGTQRYSTDDSAHGVQVDVNVYGIHSGIKHDYETGEYDHLHAVSTKQQAKQMDGIYNTMSAGSDIYNVLKS